MNKDSEYLALLEEAESKNTSGDRLYELAALNDDLAEIVASNIATQPELLDELSCFNNAKVIKAVIGNPNTSVKTLLNFGEKFPQELLNHSAFELLILEDIKFFETISPYTLGALVQQQQVPKALLKYASKHKDRTIAYLAGLHVNLSGEMVEEWHEEAAKIIPHFPLKYGCMHVTNDDLNGLFSPIELLTNFIEFIPPIVLKNLHFRGYVARNPNTKQTLLKELAKDSHAAIRNSVASNPNTPIETIKLLASNSSFKTSSNVETNFHTPTKIHKLLANDKNNKIHFKVAGDRNTPPDILEFLATNSNSRVRCYVVENASTPANVIRLLATDSDDEVRYYVAKNFNTPIDILEAIANDSSNFVRSGLARNISTPIKILEFLHTHSADKDSSYVVDLGLAENPNTPRIILKYLAANTNDEMRYCIASNPNTPLDILESFANDFDYLVRECVAVNPSTPLKVLRTLADDSDKRVRACVSANPQCTHIVKEIIFKNFAKSKTPSFSRFALFMSDYVESSVLAENSNSISWLERYAIACNQKTPKDTLKQLAQDGNRIVRATAKESLEKR